MAWTLVPRACQGLRQLLMERGGLGWCRGSACLPTVALDPRAMVLSTRGAGLTALPAEAWGDPARDKDA